MAKALIVGEIHNQELTATTLESIAAAQIL